VTIQDEAAPAGADDANPLALSALARFCDAVVHTPIPPHRGRR
jgi:hypothetical protein